MEEGDAVGETLTSPYTIGDVEPKRRNIIIDNPVKHQDSKSILELSPISNRFNEASRSEEPTADIPNTEVDPIIQNEEPIYFSDVHVEGDSRMTMRKIYIFVLGALAFLLNKVLIPFGEYVLINPTLWEVLKCLAEVILEMLLYMILAICYVFLKFIAQMDQKKTLKSIPKASGEEESSESRTGVVLPESLHTLKN